MLDAAVNGGGISGTDVVLEQKYFTLEVSHPRFYGVMVSTLDFESSDPSSNLGRTCRAAVVFFLHIFVIVGVMNIVLTMNAMTTSKSKSFIQELLI